MRIVKPSKVCEPSFFWTKAEFDCGRYCVRTSSSFHIFQFIEIFLAHVTVAETPKWIFVNLVAVQEMRSITASGGPPGNHFGRNVFSIICPADSRKKIDECSANVIFVIAQFAGLVVPRKDVMVIVPAFAECGQRNG